MTFIRTTIAVMAAAALAGCMVSEQPLIAADDAAFPFKAFSYRQTDDTAKNDTTEVNNADAIELVRDGDFYVTVGTDKDANTRLRLKDLGDNLYLAQLSSKEDGEETYIYGVLKVDPATDTADSYLAAAKDAAVGPGISKCGDNLCIDNLDDYIALAKAAIAAGTKPDATYAFIGVN